MANFFKGILVGLGAVAPGLSGSVLLVIFGLYRKTLTAISTLHRNFKTNIQFLLPLLGGIALGIVLFSKLVDFLLSAYEMQTRYAFLGLILGAIPLFCREVTKQGFRKKHCLYVAGALLAGGALFYLNRGLFPVVTEPNLLQSVLLGVAVAGSYIIPGLDSAAILSALGLYNLWVHSLATLNMAVLFPAFVGAAGAVMVVSFVMDWLISRFYTPTFSIIFGMFLSAVPAILNESCIPGWNGETAVSLVLLLGGFLASMLFSRLETLRDQKNQTS